MGKRRSRERERRSSSATDEAVATKPKKSKRRDRDNSNSSSSSRHSNCSAKSDHSSQQKKRHSSKMEKSEKQEKRSKPQPAEEKPTEELQEQRSKWDSPERGNSSRQNVKQRRHSHSRSRERERERERDRDRDRDRHDRSGRERERERERERSKERRPRSNDRRDRDRERDRDRQRRSPERRPASRSRSPRDRKPRGGRDFGRNRNQRRDNRNRNDDEQYEWGKQGDEKSHKPDDDEPVEKEKPNFGLSGALTEDTNKVNGVVVKYSEPPEARKPKRRWRLYPFKGETALPTLHIHRQSCFLVGRDRKVVDLAVDHPSCSKQHAALQYRLVPFERDDGSQGKRVRLYLIDLESANGTFLNNKKIDGRKYYELMEKDVIKFGFSSREYVLLHENSKEDQEDDDVHIKDEPQDAPAEEVNP
ncbi:hypothetical protein KR026_009469 [Drosophila bipectinata]|nr:hypothetical protein KR026_009469 [Drosophila bipectinata]